MIRDWPEQISMRVSFYGDGAKGSHMQHYVNRELGISMLATKASHAAPWVQTWSSGTWTAPTWSRLRTLLMNLERAEAADYFLIQHVELMRAGKGEGAVQYWTAVIEAAVDPSLEKIAEFSRCVY